MKFGARTPSPNKRIAAKASPARFARHNLGLKAPPGMGGLINPKRATVNAIYGRTTFSPKAPKLPNLAGDVHSLFYGFEVFQEGMQVQGPARYLAMLFGAVLIALAFIALAFGLAAFAIIFIPLCWMAYIVLRLFLLLLLGI